MSPPRMARSGDPFDRALLRAGRNDDPPRGAEDRALAILGLSTRLAARSVAMRPGPLSALHGGWSLKAIAVALALGAGVAGVWTMASRWPRLTPVVPTGTTLSPVARSDPAPGPSFTASIAPVPPQATTQASSRAPIVTEGAPGASIRHAARVPRSAPSAAPLSVEIALVQQAARALASGDAAVALGLLDAYDHQCPRGTLVEEAGALRVQALVRTGRSSEAKALAWRLLDAHPQGVLSTRLKGVLDGDGDADPR